MLGLLLPPRNPTLDVGFGNLGTGDKARNDLVPPRREVEIPAAKTGHAEKVLVELRRTSEQSP